MKTSNRLAAIGGSLLAVLTPPCAAQLLLRDGVASQRVFAETGSPFGFSGFAADPPAGDLYVAVDHEVARFDRNGIRHLVRSLPIGSRVGLIVRPTHGSELFYSDFGADVLYRLDLATGREASQPLPRNAFDLETTAFGDVLLSANPDWPAGGATTGIWLLDPLGSTGHREVVRLSGPSGPLVVDRARGDLFCAISSAAWPPPPGSTRIVRFDRDRLRATIGGGARLSEADGTVVAAGLDGAFDLAFDDRGDLLVSDAGAGDLRRIVPARAVDPVAILARGSAHVPLQLQYVDAAGGTFDPFQPALGDRVLVATNDWATIGAIHALEPKRPSLGAPTDPVHGAGTVTIRPSGLPPGQPVWLLASLLPPVPERTLLRLDGIPVWLALDLALPIPSLTSTADGAGDARFDLVFPGGFDLRLALQTAALAASPSGVPIVVTSPAAVLWLLR